MARPGDGASFSDYLTVGQAASFLGVSTATLRNWDRSGKLKPRRHPQNHYRIYLHDDLEAVLRSAQFSTAANSALAPRIDWSDLRASDHFVQFYESDKYLVDSVSGFVAAALDAGDSSMVIATLDHRVAIEGKLVAAGVDISAAIDAGRFAVLDAADTLSRIMLDGSPDTRRFGQQIVRLIAQLAQKGRRIHAFGEMVALLWADGNRHAAIQLEELWNQHGTSERITLFCAYPISAFADESHAVPFNGICACHSRVIPAESYADIDNADERLRAIARLQQKALALDATQQRRRESGRRSSDAI
jgi:hypothetical protein